jgi:hypothetical protein
MPAQGNLTVKANDGTTNITYSAISPSRGDKQSPALWRRLDWGLTPGAHPFLTHYADSNTAGNVRRSFVQFVWPIVQNTENTGNLLAEQLSKIGVRVETSVPQNIADSVVLEAIAQALNCALAIKAGMQESSNYV